MYSSINNDERTIMTAHHNLKDFNAVCAEIVKVIETGFPAQFKDLMAVEVVARYPRLWFKAVADREKLIGSLEDRDLLGSLYEMLYITRAMFTAAGMDTAYVNSVFVDPVGNDNHEDYIPIKQNELSVHKGNLIAGLQEMPWIVVILLLRYSLLVK